MGTPCTRVRQSAREMLLEETLARVTLGASHQRERPIDDVGQNPIGDAFVVLGQVSLGEAIIGIQNAIGMREANAGDGGFGIGAFRRRTRRLRLGRGLCRFRLAFIRTFRVDDFGISRTTSFAGLSSRKPWNDGCRKRPSDVHSVNSTSATSSGFTQVTPRRSLPVGGFLNGGSSIGRFFSSEAICFNDCDVNPVPTRPA